MVILLSVYCYCQLLEENFYVNLIINITYLIDKEAIAPHLYGHLVSVDNLSTTL